MAKHDVQAIQIMKEFVEGKMPVQDFKYHFDNNPIVKKTLNTDPNRVPNIAFGYNLIPYLEKLDTETISGAYSLFELIKQFLNRNAYICIPTDIYSQKYTFILKIQPSWLDITDENFLQEKVLSEIPEGLSETKQINWCKTKLKELFKYENKPPRWVQEAEWPIVNGKPLVFKNQTKEKKDDERVYFHFYDPETGIEKTVMQVY